MSRLLRGVKSIAAYLAMTPSQIQHHVNQGTIPTFKVKSVPFAMTGALDEWSEYQRTGKVPKT